MRTKIWLLLIILLISCTSTAEKPEAPESDASEIVTIISADDVPIHEQTSAEGQANPPAGTLENNQNQPDLTAVAQTLGIDVNTLREALGPPPPDLEATANILGISVEDLQNAMENAPRERDQSELPPEQNAAPTDTENIQPAEPYDCATEKSFIDVQAHPANSDYPAPELTVSCDTTTLYIQSNGIPNFEIVNVTPNDISTQNYNLELPLNPSIANEKTELALLGLTAMAVNGLPIYEPNEGGNLDFGDPVLDEILDFCNGHGGPRGDYHLHARPDCLFTDLESNTSLIIGYALDGFPILAPYVCEDEGCASVKELQSSWQRTQDVRNAWEAHTYVEGSGDLDECNGMVLADGSYAYFATTTFPYFMSCYVGTPVMGGGGDPNGQLPEDGQDGQQGQGPPPQDGQGEPPDLAAAAEQLGIDEQTLRDALGQPPPDFAAAAATLGISEEALREALGASAP